MSRRILSFVNRILNPTKQSYNLVKLLEFASYIKEGKQAELKQALKTNPEFVKADLHMVGEDFIGTTPLHLAADCLKADALKLLIENGAEVDSRDALGHTPLFTLANMTIEADPQHKTRLYMANLLLKHNAKPEAETIYGQTPLSIALNKWHIRGEKSDEEIVNLLQTAPLDTPSLGNPFEKSYPDDC